MRISFSDTLLKIYTDFKASFVIVKNIYVKGPDTETQQILENIYPFVRNTYNLDQLKSNVHSQAYISFAKNIGISPDAAFLPYLQIKRVLKGKEIGNINNVVNSYMALELKYNLSFAAYDLDTVGQNLTVNLSKGGESFTPIGGQKVILKQNDLVFQDEKGILYSFSEGYRDSSKVTKNTHNVLFAIDAPQGIEDEIVKQATQDLSIEYRTDKWVILNKSFQEIELL